MASKKFLISGNVLIPAANGVAKFIITAFNKNLRSQTELGNVIIDDSDAFNISYEAVFPKERMQNSGYFYGNFFILYWINLA